MAPWCHQGRRTRWGTGCRSHCQRSLQPRVWHSVTAGACVSILPGTSHELGAWQNTPRSIHAWPTTEQCNMTSRLGRHMQQCFAHGWHAEHHAMLAWLCADLLAQVCRRTAPARWQCPLVAAVCQQGTGPLECSPLCCRSLADLCSQSHTAGTWSRCRVKTCPQGTTRRPHPCWSRLLISTSTVTNTARRIHWHDVRASAMTE